MRRFLAGPIAVACLAQISTANAAPPGLLNRTIRTSFSVTIPFRTAEGAAMTGTRVVNKTIYVSSAGRAFISSARSEGRDSNHTEAAPEVTGNAVRFDGNRLIGVLKIGSGASQLIVTFDSNFQSCTAQVMTGGQSGKPMVWTGLSGKKLTATGPATTSNPSCSIQSGNGLAG